MGSAVGLQEVKKSATETEAGKANKKKEQPIDFSTSANEATGTVGASMGDILHLRSPIKKDASEDFDGLEFRTPALSLLRGRMSDVDGDPDNFQPGDGGLTSQQLQDLENPQKKKFQKNLRGVGRHGRLDDLFKISISEDPNVIKDKEADDVDGAALGRSEILTKAHFYLDNPHTGPIFFTLTEPGGEFDLACLGEMIWDSQIKRWRPQVNIPDLTKIPLEEKIPKQQFSQVDKPPPKKPPEKIIITGFPEEGKGAARTGSVYIKEEQLLTRNRNLVSTEELFWLLIDCCNLLTTDVRKLSSVIVKLDDNGAGSGTAKFDAEVDFVEEPLIFDLSIAPAGTAIESPLRGVMDFDQTFQSLTGRSPYSGNEESFFNPPPPPGTVVNGNFVVHSMSQTFGWIAS